MQMLLSKNKRLPQLQEKVRMSDVPPDFCNEVKRNFDHQVNAQNRIEIAELLNSGYESIASCRLCSNGFKGN
jgi:hypothetical protein